MVASLGIFILVFFIVLLVRLYQKRMIESHNQLVNLEKYHQDRIMSASIEVAEEELRKIAKNLHDDIGSTLGSISVFSEAAKQLLQQEKTEKAQNMLLKIGETSREMIENMSDIVWSVNPKNDAAKHLMDRMRVFAGDLVASSEIQLNFNADTNAEDVKLSMEQRKNIFLIFKETVYNTIKYSGGKNLYIDIKKDASHLRIIIRDDGKGFDVNNYTSKNGNGIKNMRFRAEEVNAKYHIESSPAGTVTTITV